MNKSNVCLRYVERRARVDKKPFCCRNDFGDRNQILTSMGKILNLSSWTLTLHLFLDTFTEWGLVKDQTFWIILYLPLLVPWLFIHPWLIYLWVFIHPLLFIYPWLFGYFLPLLICLWDQWPVCANNIEKFKFAYFTITIYSRYYNVTETFCP